MMNKVLYELCRDNISIMGGWRPLSARLLAEKIGITVNQIRYQLRKLKKEGYVKNVCEFICDEESCLPYHGWMICETDKLKDTEEYKKAHEEERKLCQKVFNIDIGGI